jgi:predicted transcriptional regulator
MRSAVYSWRVSPERKAALEQLARKQKRSIAELLDQAVTRLLETDAEQGTDEEIQQSLHAAAANAIGRIAGGDSNRAEHARTRLREQLRQKRARSQ